MMRALQEIKTGQQRSRDDARLEGSCSGFRGGGGSRQEATRAARRRPSWRCGPGSTGLLARPAAEQSRGKVGEGRVAPPSQSSAVGAFLLSLSQSVRPSPFLAWLGGRLEKATRHLRDEALLPFGLLGQGGKCAARQRGRREPTWLWGRAPDDEEPTRTKKGRERAEQRSRSRMDAGALSEAEKEHDGQLSSAMLLEHVRVKEPTTTTTSHHGPPPRP